MKKHENRIRMSSQTKPAHWRNHLQRQPTVWPGLGGIYLTVNPFTIFKALLASQKNEPDACSHQQEHTSEQHLASARHSTSMSSYSFILGTLWSELNFVLPFILTSPLTPRNMKTRCPVCKDSGRREERDVSLIEIFTNFLAHNYIATCTLRI